MPFCLSFECQCHHFPFQSVCNCMGYVWGILLRVLDAFLKNLLKPCSFYFSCFTFTFFNLHLVFSTYIIDTFANSSANQKCLLLLDVGYLMVSNYNSTVYCILYIITVHYNWLNLNQDLNIIRQILFFRGVLHWNCMYNVLWTNRKNGMHCPVNSIHNSKQSWRTWCNRILICNTSVW